MSNLKSFENKRWQGREQIMEFRHKAALDLIKSGPVLDLGCGDGLLLDLLKKRKLISGKGLDVSEIAVEKARAKGLDVNAFDFTNNKLPFNDNSFTTVIMLDVLEHLYQPDVLLKEVHRVAKSGIVLSVPNFVSLKSRIQVLRGGTPENNQSKKGHIYWFTYKILKKLLKQNGFEIVSFRVNTFWENSFLIGILTKLLTRIRPQIFALSFVLSAKKI